MKAILLRVLISLIARTWRIRIHGTNGGELPRQGVVAFWHGEMLPVWYVFSRAWKGVRHESTDESLGQSSPPAALVSASKDGSLLTSLLEKWGYFVVRGSSSKGGSQALKELVHIAKHHVVLVTPDGPRGPAKVFKPGAIISASRASVPLYLVRVVVSKAKVFTRSWDAFVLPMPFSTIHIALSDAHTIAQDSDREQIANYIEHATTVLHELGKNLNLLTGVRHG